MLEADSPRGQESNLDPSGEDGIGTLAINSTPLFNHS